jgi:hypothetical protein
VSGVLVVTNARATNHTTRGCGCAGTRHSPRPLKGRELLNASGASRRECERVLSTSLRGANGSRECAPDDRLRDEAIQVSFFVGKLDCFAEPVIGWRLAPTRWLAMTVELLFGCLTIKSVARMERSEIRGRPISRIALRSIRATGYAQQARRVCLPGRRRTSMMA